MPWPKNQPPPTSYRIEPVDNLVDNGEPLDALFCHDELLVYVHRPIIKLYLDRMLEDLARVSKAQEVTY